MRSEGSGGLDGMLDKGEGGGGPGISKGMQAVCWKMRKSKHV